MVKGAEEKSEIATMPNKYKDTLNDLINSLDIEFSNCLDSLNWPELIHQGLYNVSKSKSGSSTFLKKIT